MNKPIIGIIVYRNLGEYDRPYSDYTKLQSVYLKRIIEAGGIPVGNCFPYGVFHEDCLDVCDGFLFPGGSLIESYQIKAIDYAIRNKKPILGICNGLQTIAGYEYIRKKYNYEINYDIIDEFYENGNEFDFLKKVEDHNKLNPFYLSRIEESKHKVLLEKNSRVYKLFKKKYIEEPSLHEYAVKEGIFDENSLFKVVGTYNDETEIVESKDNDYFAIGVQFHIELEPYNKKLFKSFVNSCYKK